MQDSEKETLMPIGLREDEIDLGQKNGEGGFGDLYKGAWHGIPIAIKTPKTFHIPEKIEKTFQHETQVVRRLAASKTLGIKK